MNRISYNKETKRFSIEKSLITPTQYARLCAEVAKKVGGSLVDDKKVYDEVMDHYDQYLQTQINKNHVYHPNLWISKEATKKLTDKFHKAIDDRLNR